MHNTVKTEIDGATSYAALDGIPDLVCVCQDDVIRWINRAGITLLGGRDLDDLVGKPFSSFLGEDYAVLGPKLYVLLMEEGSSARTKMRNLSGISYDCELSILAHTVDAVGNDSDKYVIFARDISEIKCAAENLHKVAMNLRMSENYLRDLINNSLNLICECQNGVVRFINQSGIQLLGADHEKDVVGRNIKDLFHRNYEGVFTEEFQTVLDEDTFIPLRLKCLNGQFIDVEVAFTPMRGDDSDSFLVEAHDITDHNRAVTDLRASIENLETRVEERTASLQKEIASRREAENRLRHLATHDGLTGLPNRSLLRDRVDAAIVSSDRHKTMTAVMFIDLDGFKAVNDTLGHDAGDELLIWVSGLLQECVRATDTVARVGGDEFVVVVTDVTDHKSAALVAAKIIERLTTPVMIVNAPVTIGASIGIAMCPENAQDADELMRQADAAMYHVKTSGKNSYRFVANLEAA